MQSTDSKSGLLRCPVCGEPTDRRDRWDYFVALPCSTACEREKRWQAICPPLYQETDVQRLPEASTRVLEWEYQGVGLLLIGPTGLCKTRTAYLLLKRLFDEGKTIRAFGATQFEDQCGQAYGEGNGPSWLQNICEADVVFLDDLGKGVFTQRAEAGLASLVEHRTSHHLPIITTTNLGGAELKNITSENRGAPLIRRLREFCTIIEFKETRTAPPPVAACGMETA